MEDETSVTYAPPCTHNDFVMVYHLFIFLVMNHFKSNYNIKKCKYFDRFIKNTKLYTAAPSLTNIRNFTCVHLETVVVLLFVVVYYYTESSTKFYCNKFVNS